MPTLSAPAIAAMLQQAVGLHQQGQLATAQALYEQVLESDAQQFDALHLLGVIQRQRGNVEQAIAWIGKAISLDGRHANVHCNLGAALQDAGRTEQALHSFDTAIALDPAYAMAHGNRGNALRKLGRLDEALQSYDAALKLTPASAEVHCHRAILLHDMGRDDEALAGIERALAAKPGYAEAYCALGNILQGLQRFEQAVDAYSCAIDIQPPYAEAYCNRATALHRLLALEQALADYDRAIALQPGYASAHHFRGNVLRSLQRNDDAAAAYRSALACGADPVQLAYALASIGIGAAPASAPEGYVKNLFDQYAGHFDQHLVDKLDYQIPAHIEAAVQRCQPFDAQLTIDLGCGTGLCGENLRPYSRRLVGVDLSQPMLDKARERGAYDELVCADITQFLLAHSEVCDLMVAADVLVYLGDLAPLFGAVRQRLSPSGIFCFSVEAGEGADFTLQASNRYAHSAAYLQRLARELGYDIIAMPGVEARREHGQAVTALVVTMRPS